MDDDSGRGDVVDLTQDSDSDSDVTMVPAGDQGDAKGPARGNPPLPAKRGPGGPNGGDPKPVRVPPKGRGKRRGKGRSTASSKPGSGGRVNRFWLFTAFPTTAEEECDLKGELDFDVVTDPIKLAELRAAAEVRPEWDPLEYWVLKRAGVLADPSRVRYACLGRELCPETKRLHIQGYLEFAQKCSQTLGGIKKLLEDDTLHLESMTATRQAAMEYSKKDGEFVEFGKWIKGGQGTRSDLNDVSEMVLEGKSLQYIATEAGPQFIKHATGIMKQMHFVNKGKERPDIDVVVFWGASGTGKTRKAVEMAKRWSEENKGKPWYKHTPDKDWFDGYDMEEFVIIDDFNSELSFTRLLQMLDRYSATVGVKGATMPFVANRIIITSNLHPKDWYSGERYNEGQLKRRIRKIVKFVRRENEREPEWNDASDYELDEDE